MEQLQKKINNIDNLSLVEYNLILKDCADFKEMRAMVYVYDKMKHNNIQPDLESFKQINRLHSKTIPESCKIKVNIGPEKRLEPRRRIHKIMKGHNYKDNYQNALKHKQKVIDYLNSKDNIDIDNRIKLAKLISKNVNIPFNDARYIITNLKKTNYFKNLSPKNNTILDYFTPLKH